MVRLLLSCASWRWAVGRCVLCVLVLGTVPIASSAQRFLADDPLWEDPDRLDMPFPERRATNSRIGPLEFLRRSFAVPGRYTTPAQNKNTVGGVPNSSWYTNRHYRFGSTRAALRTGPNEEPAPSLQAQWRVTGVVSRGDLPRLVIRDATDRRFQLLFDAPAHPEMATGAAMISSRLLHAVGYNVPQHWLRRIQPRRLAAAPQDGPDSSTIDSVLARAAQRSDGTYRTLVTRIPHVARRLGPFRFQGTRPDDANDVFPHQHRRELRGLRVVAAWIHHSKLRPRHTLDVGVRKDGRRFVRHYLRDLHRTLGSAGARPKSAWSGHEHVLEVGRVVERIGTLGLSGGEWADEASLGAPAVGRFGAESFAPRQWRPEWPNSAFQHARPADAFWAAKKICAFSRADLQAIVATAQYSSPAVRRHMVQALMDRRDAIGTAYLGWGGGLGRFQVERGRLTFADLWARYGGAPDTLRRTVTWRVFDNQADTLSPVLHRTATAHEAVPIVDYSAPYVRATLRTSTAGATHVFLRWDGTEGTRRRRVVGVERQGGKRAASAP